MAKYSSSSVITASTLQVIPVLRVEDADEISIHTQSPGMA
jgi:hypothetical protein